MTRSARPDGLEDTVAAITSLGEAAAIGRIEHALFGGDQRLVRLGRYEVIELIGAGAFGKVYRARDPQLARDVALKVLAAPHARGADLLGEAQVMATVGHPNVAAIYDAGVVGDVVPPRVFFAMELVAGGNLRSWLATPRRRDEILDVLRQAGRGIAAAHAAEIVHRDIKPENLLVGEDGRVRVVDFGLARAVPAGEISPATDGGEASDGTEGREDSDGSDASAAASTAIRPRPAAATASLAGTPAYMAPELLAGGSATALSDQFAYCVTLWEAVCGVRPFVGSSLTELRAAFATPPVSPAKRRLPRRIARALERGLAVRPDDRHPSMDALLLALAPRRSARWWIAGVLAITALAAALAIVVARREPPAACPRATGELAGVWDGPRRTAIAAAFRATAVPHAEAAFDRLAAVLDRGAGEWLDARQAACAATHIRHEQSPELLDRRIACLRDWRRQLVALTATYARATPTLVDQALRAAAELPSIGRCAQTAELAAGPARPTDPAVAAQLDALDDQLAEARVKYFLGETAAALSLAEQVERDGAALRDAPVQVASTLWQGQALTALGRYAEAREVARRCFDRALGIRDQRSAALAASTLAFNGAFDSSLAAESLQWVQTGESLRGNLEHADDIEGSLAHVEGNIYLTAADPARARVALERAVAAWRRLAPEHPNAVTSLAMLGVAELNLGDAEAARRDLGEAVRLTERDLGPAHPELAAALINLGLVEAASGRYVEAAATTDRGISIQLEALGADHPLVGYARLNRGQVAAAMGETALADRELAEAARIAQATYGPAHAVSVVIELASAEHAARTGRGDAARDHAARALAAIDPSDHGPRALVESTRALAEQARGARPAALAAARIALTELLAAPSSTPSQRAIVRCNAGEVLVALGNARDVGTATTALRLAADELGHGPPDPVRRARIALALARATLDPAVAAAALRVLPAAADPALRAALTRFAR